MAFTLHRNAQLEDRPEAIIVVPQPGNEEPKLREDTLSGIWYRVFPQTGMDVSALRMLSHQSEKFAPTKGHGVLVSQSAYEDMTLGRH